MKLSAIVLWMIGHLTALSAAQDCKSTGAFILNSVYFSDATHGWAVGDGGLVLSTSNGGSTWCHQNSGTTDDLESVKFLDNQHGWSVAFENGTIISTQDGGATWRRQVAQGGVNLDSVSFVDSLHGWIVGENGVILATADGGISWHSQIISSQVYRYSWLLATQFVDNQRGWAVGRGIFATSDGGSSWLDTQANNLDSNNRALIFVRFLNSVYFVDAMHGWIAADGGLILVTTDGGTNWLPQENSGGNNLNSVYFNDLKHGWTAGNIGTIMATTDGGVTWVVQNSRNGPPFGVYVGLTAHLHSIFCWDSRRCWAVGSAESILSTNDGGVTWRIQH